MEKKINIKTAIIGLSAMVLIIMIAVTAKRAYYITHEPQIIERTVSYTFEGLTAGKTYKCYGTLMNAETKKDILGENDESVITEAEFISTGEKDTVDLVFSYQSEWMPNTVAVYAEVYDVDVAAEAYWTLD